MTDTKRLLELYNLTNLIRFSQVPRIKSETVAEHSYFVALFTDWLCLELGVADELHHKCVTYALLHDLSEIVLTDIPHPVKQMLPEIEEALIKLEVDVIDYLVPELSHFYKGCVDGEEVLIKKIVKLADTLSVLQYLASEISLGNSNVDEIVASCRVRYKRLKSELEESCSLPISIFCFVGEDTV